MKTNEPYEISPDADNLIIVCCWCHPGNSILKLFPDLAGVQISHGICQNHLKQAMSKLDTLAHNQDKKDL